MRYHKKRDVKAARVGVAVASYLAEERRFYACLSLLFSLKAQTVPPIKVHIAHDGFMPNEYVNKFLALTDFFKDFVFVTEYDRKEQHGHPHRQACAEHLIDQFDCEWLVLTNDDNYYMPTFIEITLAELQKNKALLAHVNQVHSHKKWMPLDSRLTHGTTDVGAIMVHRSLVKQVKFNDFSFAGDATWFTQLKAHAEGRIVKIPNYLFVHN